ncbi:MAG: GDP-mannose 4,6-dehydratase [Candidatus Micrarchaeia archaeon]
MTYLVTGCAGFIGSHVTERLLSRGETVFGIDDLNDYYAVSQKMTNLKILSEFDKFSFKKTDIRDKKALDSLSTEIESPEAIIHLAARAGVRASIDNPEIYFQTNVLGTLNLLELSRKVKSRRFACASSSSVYGNNRKIPYSESDVTDSPISPYAASKKSAELLCHAYSSLYSMNITCLRFFTVYGPRGRPDMAPFKFMDAISKGKPIDVYGDGTSKRDYTYIDDIVAGVIAAADKDLSFEVINLGNSSPVSLDEFILTMEATVGKPAKIVRKPEQPGDVRITFADISKAKKLLKFSPKTSLKTGLRKMHDWYLNRR